MPTETEVAVAGAHMQRITAEIDKYEKEIENLRIEYWGWQAYSRPLDECNHEASHFCTACGDDMEASRA